MRDRLIELIEKWYEKPTTKYLADYLIENGVIVSPCKVGQTVYRIVEMSTGVTSKYKVFAMEGKLHGTITPCKPTIKRFIRCVKVTKNNFIDCCENYGITVFLTKEEAVQALKEGVE